MKVTKKWLCLLAITTVFCVGGVGCSAISSVLPNKDSSEMVETPKEETPKDETPKPKEKYTVTFNSDGGGEVASQTVEEGSLLTKPTDPIKITQAVDYVFLGWYVGEKKWDFTSDVVESNMTLVARYSDENKSTGQYKPNSK